MKKQLHAIVILIIVAAAKSNPVSSELLSDPVAATADVLKSALYAFAYARKHSAQKNGPHSCGWTRATYMIGA